LFASFFEIDRRPVGEAVAHVIDQWPSSSIQRIKTPLQNAPQVVVRVVAFHLGHQMHEDAVNEVHNLNTRAAC
jgi:hypothetical protein